MSELRGRSIRRRKAETYVGRKHALSCWDAFRFHLCLAVPALACMSAAFLVVHFGIVTSIGIGPGVFGGLLLGFCLLAIVSGGISSLHIAAKDRNMVRFGCFATGEIVQNTSLLDYFFTRHRVLYRFVTKDGLVVEGKWEFADPPFDKCVSGDKFAILYDPKCPRRHIAYESALYEVEGDDRDSLAAQLLRPVGTLSGSDSLLRPASEPTDDPETLIRPI